MNFERVSIFKCSEGDILASDVYDVKGRTLIAVKETILNEYVKEKLANFGVKSVNIYKHENNLDIDEAAYWDFSQNYVKLITHTKMLFQDIIKGKPLESKRLNLVAEQIYKNIDEGYKIIMCISDIHSSDEYTYTHSINVAFYSMLIAKWLKLSSHEINKAILSGLLHDVGKVKIPDNILNKAEHLTENEAIILRNHTILGYEIVSDINNLDNDIKKAVLLHHRRMDGSGYPYYSQKLNLYSRIVAVADVFDAMTSDRVYKRKATPFEAFAMFQTTGIRLFDIKMLDIFMRRLVNYFEGVKVLLSNGEIGEIVYVPTHNITSPIIRVSDGYMDLSVKKYLKIVNIL